MNAVEIVVTGPREWMESCAAELLDARLIACAQMWTIYSRYWWEGHIEEADEVRVAMHATREAADSVSSHVRDNHPYEVPCVLIAPLDEGNQAYLRWIHESTTSRTDETLE